MLAERRKIISSQNRKPQLLRNSWGFLVVANPERPISAAGPVRGICTPSGATRPNELVAPLHDRMPVIIAPGNYEEWLASDADVRSLICPFDAGCMVAWPVSTRVNKPDNNDPYLLARIEAAA